MSGGSGDDVVAPRRSYDLAALVVFVVLATLVLLVLDGVLLRTVVGVPVVAFAPGYALVAALFPVRPPDASDPGSLDRVERLAVAVGASVSLVVLGSLALSPLFPGGLATVPFLALLVGWTVVGATVGFLRRRRHPPDVRDGVGDPRELVADGALDVLDLVLVVAVVVAAASVGHGLAAPGADDPHTNATLVTETESGELVAAGYPESVAVDEPVTTTLLLDDGAAAGGTYTVVTVLERLDDRGQVVQRSRLARESVAVPADGRASRQLTVRPDLLGESLRLSYYVYRGDPGPDPAPGSATNHLYLWLRITANGTESDAATTAGENSTASPVESDGGR